MSINAAITHVTDYRYDRRITMGPQIIRLRPAPHSRTRILAYSQKIQPEEHFLNWQQDPFGNYLARVVFPEQTDHFSVAVDLVADMASINPFDFFLEEQARAFPFGYEGALRSDLAPYLETGPQGPRFDQLMSAIDRTGRSTIDFLVDVNRLVQQAVSYTVRMEPGVQTPDQTLHLGSGSCRDSGWLLVHVLRHLGLAARFVSGYLIQLTPDVKSVDGPSGPDADFTDLHAWCEVYAPGAGWIGLDPTSGLFAGEGHIPLAATPAPGSAAPIAGALEKCEVEFKHHMEVCRVREEPRVTLPFTDHHWARIDAAGEEVDRRLASGDVRLTMGGEPTFVAAGDRDADEWNTGAVGPTKRDYADRLIRRLRTRFAPRGVLHYGQGKWYPGEQLPRWAFGLYWRRDGEALWQNPDLIAAETASGADQATAQAFAGRLAEAFELEADAAMPAFEDPVTYVLAEHRLPVNLDPETNRLDDPLERRQLAEVFERGLTAPTCMVLPLQLAMARDAGGRRRRRYLWITERWRTRRGRLFLAPGDSAAGYRLPLAALPYLPESDYPFVVQMDPFADRAPLPQRQTRMQARFQPPAEVARIFNSATAEIRQHHPENRFPRLRPGARPRDGRAGAVRSGPGDPRRCRAHGDHRRAPQRQALRLSAPRPRCRSLVRPDRGRRGGCRDLDQPVHIDGYAPPWDDRFNVIKITPDPGVLEVNVQPAASWREQVAITEALYDDARHCGLDTVKFLHDGRQVGSGGGNHIVVGAASPADSPFLRRPDLLASLIRYWQNHPSLSYLFSGIFIGPTSQAPRADEARQEQLYEMEIALAQVDRAGPNPPPWMVDRIFPRPLDRPDRQYPSRRDLHRQALRSAKPPPGALAWLSFAPSRCRPIPAWRWPSPLILRALIARFWKPPTSAR